MKLSLAMIVKNEALNLGKCLESVKDLVDEMIVVDTGSTDKTVEIAKSFGATIGQFNWTGNFSEARNFSLRLCTGDWILVLDADEMLDIEEHQAFRQAILKPGAMGYNLPQRNYLTHGSFFGLGDAVKTNDGAFELAAMCSHYIDANVLRLFRKQEALVYVGRVHEWVDPWFIERDIEAPLLNAVIHHFGKMDIKRDLAKQPIYLELAKQDATDNQNDHTAHGNVLSEALMLEDWPTVLESAQTYLKLRGAAPALVYIGGAKALVATGKFEEALKFIAPMDNKEEFAAVVLEIKAEAFQALGMLQEAVDACLQAIDADSGYTASFIRLSRILDAEGDTENARKILEAGLDQNTQDQRLWEALVGLASKHKDPQVAQDAWHAIQACPNGGEGIWHLLVAHIIKSQGDAEAAINVLEMGLVAFPANMEIAEMRDKLKGDAAYSGSKQ